MEFVGTAQPSRFSVRSPFFLAMAFVQAAIVVYGFSHTVPFDLAHGLPIRLIVHALVFGAWIALTLVQPALVMTNSLVWHRRLGWIGTGLAAAIVVMGVSAIIFALRSNNLPDIYPQNLFIMRGLIGLLVFAGLFIAAVLLRRRAQWHKRLMLCASVVVIVPGLERALPVFAMGPHWPYFVDGLIDLLVLAGPVGDLVARRRAHRAYAWGIGAVIGGQVLVDVLVPTAVPTALLHALGVSLIP